MTDISDSDKYIKNNYYDYVSDNETYIKNKRKNKRKKIIKYTDITFTIYLFIMFSITYGLYHIISISNTLLSLQHNNNMLRENTNVNIDVTRENTNEINFDNNAITRKNTNNDNDDDDILREKINHLMFINGIDKHYYHYLINSIFIEELQSYNLYKYLYFDNGKYKLNSSLINLANNHIHDDMPIIYDKLNNKIIPYVDSITISLQHLQIINQINYINNDVADTDTDTDADEFTKMGLHILSNWFSIFDDINDNRMRVMSGKNDIKTLIQKLNQFEITVFMFRYIQKNNIHFSPILTINLAQYIKFNPINGIHGCDIIQFLTNSNPLLNIDVILQHLYISINGNVYIDYRLTQYLNHKLYKKIRNNYYFIDFDTSKCIKTISHYRFQHNKLKDESFYKQINLHNYEFHF